MKNTLFALGLCLVPLTGHGQSLNALSTYSVILRGDLSTTSDVEGRTLIGGSLISGNSANFGIKLQNSVSSNDLVLRVAQNLNPGNSINLNAGSLELGGARNGRPINFNGGGTLISNPGVQYDEIFSNLTSASNSLTNRSANSVSGLFPSNPGQPGPYRFIATPDSAGLAVFSIQAADLFSNNQVQQIELLPNGATDILINVAGNTVDWTGNGNLVGNFTQSYWRERIVWNFGEATSLNIRSHNMMGQVLAPNAAVSAQANFDGSLFARTLQTSSEVHLPGYNGGISFVTPIPEPGTAALLALASLVALLRRR